LGLGYGFGFGIGFGNSGPTDGSVMLIIWVDWSYIYHTLQKMAIYMSDSVTNGSIYVDPCESWVQNGKVCCWLCICQFLQHMSIYISNFVTGGSLYVTPC